MTKKSFVQFMRAVSRPQTVDDFMTIVNANQDTRGVPIAMNLIDPLCERLKSARFTEYKTYKTDRYERSFYRGPDEIFFRKYAEGSYFFYFYLHESW